MNTSSGFPHERLDAYRLAQDLVVACVHATNTMPRGFAEIRDQARRSALATVRHIAEGASRTSPKDKRARFVVARGEVAELHATLESAASLGFFPEVTARELGSLTQRVGAMLTGLIKREGRRIKPPG